MATTHFRRIDRRRTARVTLAVPLVVHAETDRENNFRLKTYSHSLNSHGALIELNRFVDVGETVRLVNEITGQSAEGRVASVRRDREARTYVGVAFMSANPQFWHMSFPVPGSRPLRWSTPAKLGA
jgi:PilZ domain